jgi:hypothetical protein
MDMIVAGISNDTQPDQAWLGLVFGEVDAAKVTWIRAFLVGEGGFEGLAEKLVDRPVSLLTVLRAVSNFFAASAGTFGHVGTHDA